MVILRRYSLAVFAVGLGVLITLASTPPSAASAQQLGICGRTQQIQDGILAAIAGVDDCALVTDTHLAGISLLSLSSKGITELKLGDFIGLSSVWGLFLDYNELAILPDRVFDGLSSVTTLTLNNNGLANLPAGIFDPLVKVGTLNINDNELNELPKRFTDNPPQTLRFFNVSDNPISALPAGFLGRLAPGFTLLNLAGITLTEEDFDTIINDFTSLETLHLTDTGLDAARLTALLQNAGLGLTRLYVGSNDLREWLTEGTPSDEIEAAKEALAKFSFLELDLSNTGLDAKRSEIILRALEPADLFDLNLSNNQLVQFPVERLPEFKGLLSLRLARSGINSNAAQQIVEKVREELQLLDLSLNAIATVPEKGFGRLNGLTRLFLGGNDLKELPLDSFQRLTNLRRLELHNNKLTSIDPSVFNDLTSLQNLYLHGNPNCDGLTRDDFGHLTALRVLWLPDRPCVLSEPSVLHIEPAITSVTLRAGEQVRLAVDVYGVQDILDNRLADDAEDVRVSWSDGGRGGTFAATSTSEMAQDSGPGDREVVYQAPDSPGTYNITAAIAQLEGCYGSEEIGDSDEMANARCTAEFEITVRRPSSVASETVAPINPSGPIPSSITDSGGFAFSVFTPEEGGEFIGEGFEISAGPGAVPNGEIIGLAMANAGEALNIGQTHQRYTLLGDAYAIGVVDASGESVSTYRLNTFAEACVPLPDALRSNIADVSLTAINGDGTLTILSSSVKLASDGTDVCGRVSSLPTVVAVGAEGAPADFPTPSVETEIQTPETGGYAPTFFAVLLVLVFGLAMAAIGSPMGRHKSARALVGGRED